MSKLSKDFLFDQNVIPLIKKFNTFSTLNKALDVFREHNNAAACEYIIKQGADNLYNNLSEACKKGQLEIVKLITREKLRIPPSYIAIACEHGHYEIVKHLFNSEYYHHDKNNDYLMSACIVGEMKCVEFLIEKDNINYKFGMEGACMGGHEDIMEMMCDLQKITPNGLTLDFYTHGLVGACRGGHQHIVNQMLKKFEKKDLFQHIKKHVHMIKLGASDWNRSLSAACMSGNLDIVQLIVSKAQQSNCVLHWSEAFMTCCEIGNLDLAKFIYNNGNNNKWRIAPYLSMACKMHHIDIVKWIIKCIITTIKSKLKSNFYVDALTEVCCSGDIYLVRFLFNNEDVRMKNPNVTQFVLWAYTYENTDIGHFLLEQYMRDQDVDYLFKCAFYRKIETLMKDLLIRYPGRF